MFPLTRVITFSKIRLFFFNVNKFEYHVLWEIHQFCEKLEAH